MVEILPSPTITRRRFTVDEYDRMIEAGILSENERVELIDGEIVEMAAVGGRHAACVRDLNEWFLPRLIGRAIVDIQNPVRLRPRSEPEPDFMILRWYADRYHDRLPGPEDVLLIIEVSDSSLPYDRETKLPLYAAAGIPEVWIVDLQRRRVLVHRQPDGDLYREAVVIDQGTLTPLAFPDLALPLTEIFG
jgi:Uma2 family endonuclease